MNEWTRKWFDRQREIDRSGEITDLFISTDGGVEKLSNIKDELSSDDWLALVWHIQEEHNRRMRDKNNLVDLLRL